MGRHEDVGRHGIDSTRDPPALGHTGGAVKLRSNGLPPVALAMVVGSLPVFLVGTLAVEIRHSLHFDTEALGIAIAVYYLGAASSSLPVSRLVEHVGGARVMRIAMLGAAVLFALIGGLATSWAALVVLLLLAGGISGSMNPAANLFLARRAESTHHGLVFGIKQAAVPFASLLGGLAVPAIALTVGWRWAFGAGTLLALVAAAVIPRSRTTLAEHRRRHPYAARAPVASAALITLTVGLGLGVMASSGATAFLVSAAVSLGFAKASAGLVAAAAGGAAVATRITIGARADRRGGGHLRVVVLLMLVGVAGYGLLASGTLEHSHWLFVLGALLALGGGWGYNGLFTFAVIRTHRDTPAAATGVTQIGGRLGGMLGPAVFGLVADHVSYSASWVVAAVTAAVAAAVVVVGRRLLVAARSQSLAPGPTASEPPAPAPGAPVPDAQ